MRAAVILLAPVSEETVKMIAITVVVRTNLACAEELPPENAAVPVALEEV